MANQNNNERRWIVPNKRAASYASERRAKVHQRGEKMGQELTDYEAGLRSGYLQCQSDHAGLFRYKDALGRGLSKSEAKAYSKQKGKKKKRYNKRFLSKGYSSASFLASSFNYSSYFSKNFQKF